MHYANNIVMYDEIGLDFLRELFSKTTRSVYFKVSDERVRNWEMNSSKKFLRVRRLRYIKIYIVFIYMLIFLL